MTRTKGVIGMMIYEWLAIGIAVVTGGLCAAQGSRPRATPSGAALSTAIVLPAAGQSVSGSALTDSHKGKTWIRVKRPRPGVRVAEEVEFIDEEGRVAGRIARGDQIRNLLVVPADEYVGVIRYGGGRPDTAYTFIYYDAGGRDLWTADICCADGMVEDAIKMSGDGSVVALLDTGEGEGCPVGEDGYLAPPGCVGLRVFTAEGKEILGERDGERAEVSPTGKYVLYATAHGRRWWLLHTESGKRREIDKPEGVRPGAVDDEGVVSYTERKGYPRYRHSPSKGLEKLRD